MTRADLTSALRLVVITDRTLAAPRSVEEVVRAALRAGCRCIQVRDKHASARALAELAHALRGPTRAADALLIVNDRFDVALATQADGVHVGPEDLPVAAIRGAAPQGFVIGASADDPEVARRLVTDGADYVGCGTVFATTTKPEAGSPIGKSRLVAVVEAVDAPIVAIGGITPERAAGLADSGIAGVATVGSVMAAPDPEQVCRQFLRPAERA